ncbi:unnamed protein product [Strongylus vulgaris]|uniref:Reverse transcriptase domain-containing protein n=1 Tax=Strongylus vulgaris TaxID=40348 RepID=A0A3P7JDW6_STRVU|nr:unnamed protein product [Strongylus vulgaris]
MCRQQPAVGVHQGSVLPPLLFITVMDAVMEGLKRQLPWVLLYADNVVLMVEREFVESDVTFDGGHSTPPLSEGSSLSTVRPTKHKRKWWCVRGEDEHEEERGARVTFNQSMNQVHETTPDEKVELHDICVSRL